MCKYKINMPMINLIICNFILISISISTLLSDSNFKVSNQLSIKDFSIIVLVFSIISLFISCLFLKKEEYKEYQEITSEI